MDNMLMIMTKRSVGISLLIVICMLIPQLGKAQNIDEQMRSYFGDVKSGKYPAIPKQLTLGENSKAVIGFLPRYLSDSVSGVRSKAYTIAMLAGNSARQEHSRQTAVDQLILGVKDPDGGNAGAALDFLSSFHRDDFSAGARDTLRSLFRRRAIHFEKIMKLCGYLELTDLSEGIRRYTEPGNSQAIRWAALISLARMGDAAAGGDMMRRTRKLPVNDDVIYSIFPDLVYTRNEEAVSYMIEVLQRDDATCMSADAERQAPIPCGYRIMEQLAPVIKGYPLALDASGDVKTNDYVAALKTVREWFTKHPNYEILKDKY